MTPIEVQPHFDKYADGLVPVIVQHSHTARVLMLGYMNEAAWTQTMQEQRITFFSRSRQCLWTKGATSGHFLNWHSVHQDCDADALLFGALPEGPVCHTGAATCFDRNGVTPGSFLKELESIISDRARQPAATSYTASLLAKGMNKIAQKVGEEAIELVIEAKDQNHTLFCNEAADLLYHFLVLLRAKDIALQEIESVLQKRHLLKS